MAEFENQFAEQRMTAPGERYATLAAEISEGARLFGLNMTPQGQTALAVLIQEVEDWWVTSDGARVVRFVIRMLPKLSHALSKLGQSEGVN